MPEGKGLFRSDLLLNTIVENMFAYGTVYTIFGTAASSYTDVWGFLIKINVVHHGYTAKNTFFSVKILV